MGRPQRLGGATVLAFLEVACSSLEGSTANTSMTFIISISAATREEQWALKPSQFKK